MELRKINFCFNILIVKKQNGGSYLHHCTINAKEQNANNRTLELDKA